MDTNERKIDGLVDLIEMEKEFKEKFETIRRAYRLAGVNDVDVRGFYYPGREELFFTRADQGASPDELWEIATAPGWLFNAARTSFIGGRQRFSGLWPDEATTSIAQRCLRRGRRRILAAEN